MKLYEEKNYRGFILKKKGKQHIQIWNGSKFVGYATTEKDAKKIVDNK